MSIRQITIVGTGLIGGSFALALKKNGFHGWIVGCDRDAELQRARQRGAIDEAHTNPADAIRNSDLVVLATPVSAILEMIDQLGPALPPQALMTDVGSTKAEIVARAFKIFGKDAGMRFLGGHPMAGKEDGGIDLADPDLFEGATWFVTPGARQNIHEGMSAEFLSWLEKIGARAAEIDATTHDELCAWISHVPQMISTALAAALVDHFGDHAAVMEAGGRALREMTRISSSPYSMWRDIALTNKKNIQQALHALEQRLAHIRENLDTRELAEEFAKAHELKKNC
ncbi:MAG TPA: prephenate dehydrogenase/arogenate dehydrogenase family protein [Terriglobales bacterium]|nr:prephenate dehydrogenase/arogenate dehydrogenase family protein [Terriglobales bacterium]